MTEQLATTISVAVAIALALVSLAYGLALGHLRHHKREARGPARPATSGRWSSSPPRCPEASCSSGIAPSSIRCCRSRCSASSPR